MQKNIKTLMDELNGNLEEYSPIPFWFLNDELTKERLQAQLEDFKEKGVDGVVLHPRIGIPKELEYLSEEYFELMLHIVKTAKRLNMKVILYDEAMYPSGSAHGEVVKSNPKFAAIGIKLADSPEEGKVIAGPKDGKYIVQAPCGGTIRGIHFGEDDGEPGAPWAADILNPEAVNKFIELTHDNYYKHLKEYFGNVIIGFFTDEPNVLGRRSKGFHAWADGFEKEFIAAGGNPDNLWGLFAKETNEDIVLYKEMIKQRLNDVYYKSLSDWCAAHGIALMGHPAQSADIDEEKYFHIPGQDLVFRWVSPEIGGTKGKDSVMAKCSSDAARHMERRRNSNECFGVCSRDNIAWYFTGGDMKWFIDWLGVRGVNLYIPHAFYYSLLDRRKDERPPDVGPGNIWWKYYRLYSDYIKRVSYLMTDSRNAARVAVLCESGHMPIESVEPFYENQIEFNYLQKCMLDKCRIKNGKLCIAGYEYEYVMGDAELAGEVRHIKSIDEIGERDLVAAEPLKKLRATHLFKNGVSMYFLVNEGFETISQNVTVPVSCNIIAYDLWSGKSYRCDMVNQDGTHTEVKLELNARQSILLICSDEQCDELPVYSGREIINLTDKAVLAGEDTKLFTKEYVAHYNAAAVTGKEIIAVTAEEMVECWCNGSFAGVSFWNTHCFDCGSLLHCGDNEIKFVVTGNAANRYTDNRIEYGIGLSF